jgi:carboxyl-terminal processing protease
MFLKLRGLLIPLLFLSIQCLALQPFEATDIQSETLMNMLKNLKQDHYVNREINDEFSAELFDNYLNTLDPSKSFLLTNDAASLSEFRLLLDEQLLKGDSSFGFTVFKEYRRIAEQQIQKNIDLLESDTVFDLSDTESIATDFEQREFMATPQERDEWWRIRTEDALIRLIISDKELPEARELLIKRYKSQLQQLQEMDGRDVFQMYCNAIAALYDPHTTYFSPRTSENFNINMSLSLEGIGAVLTRDEDYTKVVRVVPGGPADKQGQLKAGDKISGVAQGKEGEMVDLVGGRLDDAVDKIRGPKDSIVRLEVIPAKSSGSSGASIIIEIIRDKVKLEEQAVQSEIIEVPAGDGQNYRLAVIDIPTFYFDFEAYRNGDNNPKRTSADVIKLLEGLSTENIDGVILDLRGNGGGSLNEATELTDLFVNPGPVVQIRHSSERIDRRQRARRPAYYSGPLVVVIDRLSASASEILAGAIQDYGRGVIVGSQSFGKGTVQNLLPLNEGQLKMTESKFYRISGASTQHRGVVPDITFPSDHLLSEIGESNEKKALPWDTIKPASYKIASNLPQFLPVLEQAHKERVKDNADFIFIEERNKLAERYDTEDKHGLSLVLSQRKSLKEAREQQALALENQRRTDKGLDTFETIEAWRDQIKTRTEGLADASDENTVSADKVVDDIEQTSIVDTEQEVIDKEKTDDRPLDEKDPRLLEAGYILVDMIKLVNKSKLATKRD